jgi:hypothetical protein
MFIVEKQRIRTKTFALIHGISFSSFLSSFKKEKKITIK